MMTQILSQKQALVHREPFTHHFLFYIFAQLELFLQSQELNISMEVERRENNARGNLAEPGNKPPWFNSLRTDDP